VSTVVPVTELSDAELMLRVQADDPEAFGALYDRFGARAYRVAFALARDPTRAEDIVQDAFLSIWRGRAMYQPQRGALVAWILGVVRNRALDALRRNGRHDTRRADEEQIDQQLQSVGSAQDRLGEREEAAELRGVLARLPAAQREVIALAYFGELSTSEIASELSLPLGTVKGRIRLGLQKLRGDWAA